MRQYHGIKVGDLVRFKHHIFDEHKPVHLVAEVLGTVTVASRYKDQTTHYIRLITDHPQDRHRADDFVIVSRS